MLDWLAETWNEFVDFIWRVFLSLLDLLKDFFIWIMEQLLDLVVLLIDGMGDLMGGLDVAQYFSSIPPETAHVLSLVGLSEAMGMIVACLTIRILLQLIPFVRLGS